MSRFGLKDFAIILVVVWTYYIPEFSIDLSKSYSMSGYFEETKGRSSVLFLIYDEPVKQRYKLISTIKNSDDVIVRTEDGDIFRAKSRNGLLFRERKKHVYSGVSIFGPSNLISIKSIKQLVDSKSILQVKFAPYTGYGLLKKDLMVEIKYERQVLNGFSTEELEARMQEQRLWFMYWISPMGIISMITLYYLRLYLSSKKG